MWRAMAIAVIAFFLADAYFWNSKLLHTGMRLVHQIALAFGISYS